MEGANGEGQSFENWKEVVGATRFELVTFCTPINIPFAKNASKTAFPNGGKQPWQHVWQHSLLLS